MCRLLRFTFVWLLATSFVVSGAMWRHCMAAQPASANVVAAHQTHDAPSHHAHDTHHSDHAVNHQRAPDHPAPPAADDHTCGKCCSLCGFTGTPLPDITGAALNVSAVVFSCDLDRCSGRTVSVDPGIPKPIV